MAAPRGQGSPVVLSGLAIAAGTARFVGSWVPVDWHPASRAQGCGPQVRELGLGGAGNHVFCPLFAVSEPTEMAIAEKPRLWGRGFLPLHPFAYSSDPRAFPKQPSGLLPTGLERITGRKARGLQTEKINCKCQTFFSLS